MKINGDQKFTNQIFIIGIAKFAEVIDLWVLMTQQDLYSAASIYGYDSEKLELSPVIFSAPASLYKEQSPSCTYLRPSSCCTFTNQKKWVTLSGKLPWLYTI